VCGWSMLLHGSLVVVCLQGGQPLLCVCSVSIIIEPTLPCPLQRPVQGWGWGYVAGAADMHPSDMSPLHVSCQPGGNTAVGCCILLGGGGAVPLLLRLLLLLLSLGAWPLLLHAVGGAPVCVHGGPWRASKHCTCCGVCGRAVG
jgi:hypothetical protein